MSYSAHEATKQPAVSGETAAGYRMPAEWDRHERTVMSWPTDTPIWDSVLEDARNEYAATARAIARFEDVLMVAHPADEKDAKKRCGSDVEVIAIPIDDSWMRDSGPIIVRGVDGERYGVDFRFNAYGERFVPYDQDATVAARVLEYLGLPRRQSEMVLEGGSIAVDGEGTLITTEQCLLNPNRNPTWTRAEIEAELRAQLGVEKIIWLPWGRIEDLHTDGHVDVVCMFARAGVVIAQGCEDRANPNHSRMQENLRVLRSATDASGRPLQVVELPFTSLVKVNGHDTMVSNVNFYIANGSVLVPVADVETDEGVLKIFHSTFPDREVLPVSARTVAFGGGGLHCITQQIPAGK